MRYVYIKDHFSGDVHRLPARTRCLTKHGPMTIGALEIGEHAAVESDDLSCDEDHPIDANGDAVVRGRVWWSSSRVDGRAHR